MKGSFHLSLVQRRYDDRRRRNPQYSLRAFAKDIGTNPGQLSRLLRGDAPVSLKRAEIIADHLRLLPDERQLFISSVTASRLRKGGSGETIELHDDPPPAMMDHDTFEAISNLLHFALLELTYVKDFKSDVRWMARRLGVTAIEVRDALNRLETLGLMKKVKGTWTKTHKTLAIVYRPHASAAYRNMHKAALAGASAALHRHPPDKRCNHSVTLAINPNKLSIANKMILECIEEITKILESGKQEEVYELAVALNPVCIGSSMR